MKIVENAQVLFKCSSVITVGQYSEERDTVAVDKSLTCGWAKNGRAEK
jgi:hypothetical protein